MNMLDIRNLTIEMDTSNGPVKILDKVNLQVGEGEIHTLVGESGSGKSLLAKAILGFINPRWRVTADRLWWNNRDLLNMDAALRRQITGRDMAMIFQNPNSYLDPNSTVGEQLREAIPKGDLRGTFIRKMVDKRTRVVRLLHRVGVKDHDQVIDSYPFELSVGVAQKVSIAMAIAHRPKLLIADEPTTAMEPSTRQQIYRLLTRLSITQGMSMLMITQDVASVMPDSDNVTLLYCGQLMEAGNKQAVFDQPQHPYTEAMLRMSLRDTDAVEPKTHLPTLPGAIPTLQHLPIGCRLGPRCPNAQKDCVMVPKVTRLKQQSYHCHHPLAPNKRRKSAS
ncbi:oligopeptide/dipeptide ABC transporter ATP-binding protein [Idiomarina xiamenensis]|uniref:Peptide ABC transporter ATPase n=1 Tax=Idiomarina xiamenensis 10-D-4 TaxID=740709 RepID=K2L4L7_9GAMM|nr:oligopeptide/dipeptide ABC transporter ATP-binding protein [Idiomarina xiamenensis]EKE84770.1 peptide ABC transporter ATPase [Idiomarina xiamenensis 10-D-4]